MAAMDYYKCLENNGKFHEPHTRFIQFAIIFEAIIINYNWYLFHFNRKALQ